MKPANILTVKEAIELIDSDTRQNPVVSNKELIKRSEYLNTNFRGAGMNYTIFLVKRAEDGRIVPNGKKFVSINSQREQYDLLNAIRDHYKSLSGRDVDPEKLGLYSQTNVLERDVAGASTGMARINKKSTLKYGDALTSDNRSRTVEDF